MRSSLAWLASLAFVVACADAPIAPLLQQPPIASFDEEEDDPPPPWQRVAGSIVIGTGTVNFDANFFANKPGNVAWLQFQSSTTAGVTFSANARIMSVNGDVSGVGTISINGNPIQLNEIDTFNYESYRTNGALSFSGGGIRLGSVKGGGIIDGDGGEVICCNIGIKKR